MFENSAKGFYPNYPWILNQCICLNVGPLDSSWSTSGLTWSPWRLFWDLLKPRAALVGLRMPVLAGGKKKQLFLILGETQQLCLRPAEAVRGGVCLRPASEEPPDPPEAQLQLGPEWGRKSPILSPAVTTCKCAQPRWASGSSLEPTRA